MRDLDRRITSLESMRPAHGANVEAMRQRFGARINGIAERLREEAAQLTTPNVADVGLALHARLVALGVRPIARTEGAHHA